MKILVIGGGGREHALVWKLAQDSERPEIFCAPGNAGTAELATNLALSATDLPGLLEWARGARPDLTVVGPEAPLCAGVSDLFQQEGLLVFGPTQAAARLEGSKAFAKEVMRAAKVPTAGAERFSDAKEAQAYLHLMNYPVVIKADGLAAGKGVVICHEIAEAQQVAREFLDGQALGEAGRTILIENYLEGEEVSAMALVDGRSIVTLASAQDHKRIFDGDQGPNTGGMGAYSPAPIMTMDLWDEVMRRVFRPVVDEMNRRGVVYRGVLYAGLMITKEGPQVLEFNCRFGDPETQAILPRWAGDLAPALRACARGRLRPELVQWKPEACACVVLAAPGYPGPCQQGGAITGLAAAGKTRGVAVFHAGTQATGGEVVTAGGRVLGVSALGRDLAQSVARCYQAIKHIHFDGMQYRRDIAHRALRR